MKIIGHRGAAGLAPENTVKSIKVAKEYPVSAIEFDIRITKDKQLVVCHDKDLEKVAGKQSLISNLIYHEIKKIKTISGEPIPTLQQVIKASGDTPLIIEGKDTGWPKPLAEVIKKSKFKTSPTIFSFHHKELLKFQKLCPDIKVVALEQHNPLKTIYFAKDNKMYGVCLKVWIYQPVAYWLARKYNLEMYAYTINHTWLAKIFHKLYPRVSIITNYPNKLT